MDFNQTTGHAARRRFQRPKHTSSALKPRVVTAVSVVGGDNEVIVRPTSNGASNCRRPSSLWTGGAVRGQRADEAETRNSKRKAPVEQQYQVARQAGRIFERAILSLPLSLSLSLSRSAWMVGTRQVTQVISLLPFVRLLRLLACIIALPVAPELASQPASG